MKKPDYDAHISVMDKEEIDQLNLPLPEHNQEFEFELSGIQSCDPDGWDEMERVWFIECKSPQLEKLRTQYGFTPLMNGNHEFHITIAVKPAKGEKDMNFASISEALQYLSDTTQQRIVISANEKWKEDIVKFLIDNPNPPDSKVHEWADEIGIEHSEVEAEIYKLATKEAQREWEEKSE